MNLLDGVPVVGQYTIVGLLIAMLAFVFIQFIRGEWVTRKQVEQVQKTSDTYLKAWEVSMQSQKELTEVAVRLTAVADTFEHVMTSLPNQKDEGTP